MTRWTAACQVFLSSPISWSLLKLMPIALVMILNHLIFYLPLLLLPSIFPASGSFLMSQLFPSGGQSFSFSISLSDGQSGLITSPRDSQEYSPTPQFISINFSTPSILYGPSLTLNMTTEKKQSFD